MLDLPAGGGWTCQLGGWPEGYPARIFVWPGDEGGRLAARREDAVPTCWFRLSRGERHKILLREGRYTATLQGDGCVDRTEGIVGRRVFRIVAGEPTATVLAPDSVIVTEHIEINFDVQGERREWNSEFWIEGPGSNGHRRLLYSGPCRRGTAVGTRLVSMAGNYLVYDSRINFASVLSLDDLRQRSIVIPDEGRVEARVVDTGTGKPIAGAEIVFPLVFTNRTRWVYASGTETPEGMEFRVPAGSYWMSAEADGYVDSDSTPVLVRAGETTNWVATLHRMRTVTVDLAGASLVLGETLVLARLAENGKWEDWDSCDSNAEREGRCKFEELAPGRFRIYTQDTSGALLRGPVLFGLSSGATPKVVRLP